MSEERVLLTGATGFVGRHIARRFVAHGEHVMALCRNPTSPRLPAGTEALPIPDAGDELAAVVRKARPDICIHLATHFVVQHSPNDIVPLIEANVAFGTRLAEALVTVGDIPLLDTGTVWQHVDGAERSPANLYAATKQAQQDIFAAYALRYGLEVARLSLSDTYGPDDPRPKLVPALVNAARTGESLPLGSGDQLIDLVYVDDVVRAFGMLGGELVKPPDERGIPILPGSRNCFAVSCGRRITIRDLVTAAEEAAGRPLPVQWGARPARSVDGVLPRPVDPPLPGWQPAIGLVEGLRLLLAE